MEQKPKQREQIGVRSSPELEEAVATLKTWLHVKSDSAAITTTLQAVARKGQHHFATMIRNNEPEKSKSVVKILGSISAGAGMQVIPLDEPRDVEIEEPVGADWYGLDVVGNSMDGGELPIKNGDYLIFEPSADAPNGWVVHAEWCEKEMGEPFCTVKKFRRVTDGAVTLEPANKDGYLPIVFDPEDQKVERFEIRGILRRHIQRGDQ